MDLRKLRQDAIEFTKVELQKAITPDTFIIQASAHAEELQQTINKHFKRLRDWYDLYCPELSRGTEDMHEFLRLAKLPREEIIAELGVEETIGKDFEDQFYYQRIIKLLETLSTELDMLEKDIKKSMKKHMPNLTAVCGGIIGARLLRMAGSLKQLAEFPASTIQILGAEKALFRHLKTGARAPKYGTLLAHEYVANAPDPARAARKMADKASIAAKVDYFKGEFIGDKLADQL